MRSKAIEANQQPFLDPSTVDLAQAITLEELINKTWLFGRGNGSIIAPQIRLLPDGQILGYSHPNESRWGLEQGRVVFYHSDGRITTRFNVLRKENGKLILSGPFLLGGQVIHVLREVGSQDSSAVKISQAITLKKLTSTSWLFGRGNGSIIAPQIRLLPDGQILGYSHPNESRWGLEQGRVVFYHSDGRITTRFNILRKENGKLILSGPFLLGGQVIHVLKEIGSRSNFAEDIASNIQNRAGIPISGNRVIELDSFDREMIRFMQERNIKAGTLAISKDGRLIFSRGYGYGDPQLRTVISPNALMRIASVEKPITKAAIKTLVRQGRLSLNTRVFPLLGITQVADPRLNNLVIQHLLEHQWHEGAQGFDAVQVAEVLRIPSPAGPLDIARYIAGQTLRYNPGDNGSYCNYCYDLLREIVRRVSGQSYAEFVKTRLGLFDAESTYAFSRDRHSREIWYSDPGYCHSVYQPYRTNQVLCTEGGFPVDPPTSLITSAPALAEFFGRYWINGESRSPTDRGYIYWFFGSWVGTFSLAYQRPDGTNIVVLFNQRTDPSGLDYGQIKDVMDRAANTVPTWK